MRVPVAKLIYECHVDPTNVDQDAIYEIFCREANAQPDFFNDRPILYVSNDIYSKLLKSIAGAGLNEDVHNRIQFVHSYGTTPVLAVPKLKKFLFIGSEEEYKNLFYFGVPTYMLSNEEHEKLDNAVEAMLADDTHTV